MVSSVPDFKHCHTFWEPDKETGMNSIKVKIPRAAPRETMSRSSRGQKIYLEAVKPSKTVGRNDPCPCGSGLKSKRCHRGILIPKASQIEEHLKR